MGAAAAHAAPGSHADGARAGPAGRRRHPARCSLPRAQGTQALGKHTLPPRLPLQQDLIEAVRANNPVPLAPSKVLGLPTRAVADAYLAAHAATALGAVHFLRQPGGRALEYVLQSSSAVRPGSAGQALGDEPPLRRRRRRAYIPI